MAINKTDFLNEVKKRVYAKPVTVIKGAGETIKNKVYTAKQNAETRDIKRTLIKKTAQNEFLKSTGGKRSYNPSDESREDNKAYAGMIKKAKLKYKNL